MNFFPIAWEQAVSVFMTFLMTIGTTGIAVPLEPETAESIERAVPGVVNADGFYLGPSHCRKEIKKRISLTPTGEDDLYSREDAIVIGKQQCFFNGHREGSIMNLLSTKEAINTGKGEAWVFQEVSEYAVSYERCPEKVSTGFSPVIVWNFELNRATGDLSITESCGRVILD